MKKPLVAAVAYLRTSSASHVGKGRFPPSTGRRRRGTSEACGVRHSRTRVLRRCCLRRGPAYADSGYLDDVKGFDPPLGG